MVAISAKRTHLKTPPLMSGGLPGLGHALAMANADSRNALFKRGFEEHGNIFAVKLGPQMAAVISGPEFNKIYFQETDKSLNIDEAMDYLKLSVGEIFLTAPLEKYENQRPVQMAFFSRDKMARYVEAMNSEVQLWLDGLGQQGETDLTSDFMRLTQHVVGHAFLGPDFREELPQAFWDLYAHIAEALNPIIPAKWPTPANQRRDRARPRMQAIFSELVEKRRQNPDAYDDMITVALATQTKDGGYLTDTELIDVFIALMFAGHETTAGQAAWTIANLLQHPDYMQQVEQEVRQHVPLDGSIDGGTLRNLTYTYYAIDETTRLNPSADVGTRLTTAPVQFGDYEVPAGWRVMVNAVNSHHMDDVFSNPQAFDPMRYCPANGEGKNPYAIMGFGGGIHKCTGINFAKNEMAIISARLLQQFDIELLSDNIQVVAGKGASYPDAVRIRYRRRSDAEMQALAAAAAEGEASVAGCPHHG